MHTPFARLVFLLLIALLADLAHAQDLGKVPGLDESKIPDWIKRQAASPQKTIIHNAAPKPKAEVVPVRVNRGTTRRLPPLAMEPTAAGPAAPTGSEAPAVETVAPALVDAAPAAASPDLNPTPAPSTPEPVAGLPPGVTQPEPGTVEPPPAPAPTSAAPAPAEPAAPPGLVLVERSDPVLTADLIDARLADASVTVAFTVGTKGEVIAPQVVATSDRRLNRAVLRAVSEWRYAPVSEPRPHSVKFSFAVTP